MRDTWVQRQRIVAPQRGVRWNVHLERRAGIGGAVSRVRNTLRSNSLRCLRNIDCENARLGSISTSLMDVQVAVG
jgi:hypothetical protein